MKHALIDDINCSSTDIVKLFLVATSLSAGTYTGYYSYVYK